ncbi:MAG TPA: hypothetical protein P5526_15700 [Anaerolineae bacterium]|nr:hypothetical protein [Anaerolineae bacterium]MCB0224100.1 hypothetical protein [Anaerolineae bacterium]HRV93604.1 hypothetical protein [Anaerolineae bacterium]
MILDYLYYLWQAIWNALIFNPRVYEVVSEYQQTFWVTLGVAILGGASLLIGQSVVLFVNQVTPARFILSMVLNGLQFAISLLVWAVLLTFLGGLIFDIEVPFRIAIRIMFLTAAPMVFGFMVLIPYLGLTIQKILQVWSLLITIQIVNFEFGTNLFQSLIVVGLGWLLTVLLGSTIGRPITALRDFIWRKFVGATLDADIQEVYQRIARQKVDQVTQQELEAHSGS